MDSSWEVILAKYLDSKSIRWIRPPPVIYSINDKSHKYFSDFYLLDYDIYLDPKNKIVITKQQEKLDIVSSMITLYYGELDHLKNIINSLEPPE